MKCCHNCQSDSTGDTQTIQCYNTIIPFIIGS